MNDKPKFLFPMQNLARYKVIPFVMLLMALLLIVSCNKDDDEKNKKFRLSGSKYLEDDSVQTNNSFHYLDDRVSLVRSCYYLEQEDSVKTEIDYTDEDNLEQVSYFKAVNQWWPFDKHNEGWAYVYEEGTGNYPELLIPGSGLIYNKFYPGPVKSKPALSKRKSVSLLIGKTLFSGT